jgi:hypothetical protein
VSQQQMLTVHEESLRDPDLGRMHVAEPTVHLSSGGPDSGSDPAGPSDRVATIAEALHARIKAALTEGHVQLLTSTGIAHFRREQTVVTTLVASDALDGVRGYALVLSLRLFDPFEHAWAALSVGAIKEANSGQTSNDLYSDDAATLATLLVQDVTAAKP